MLILTLTFMPWLDLSDVRHVDALCFLPSSQYVLQLPWIHLIHLGATFPWLHGHAIHWKLWAPLSVLRVPLRRCSLELRARPWSVWSEYNIQERAHCLAHIHESQGPSAQSLVSSKHTLFLSLPALCSSLGHALFVHSLVPFVLGVIGCNMCILCFLYTTPTLISSRQKNKQYWETWAYIL